MTSDIQLPITLDDVFFPDTLRGNEYELFSVLDIAWDSLTENLQKFAQSANFTSQMSIAFGDNIDFSSLQEKWKQGEIIFPTIEVRSHSELGNAWGAFSPSTGRIYLAKELLENKPLEQIVAVFLEEYGHFIDGEINKEDSSGDEGAIFSALVRGEELTKSELEVLKNEDDSLEVFLNGEQIRLEQSGEINLTFSGLAGDLNEINLAELIKQKYSLTNLSSFNITSDLLGIARKNEQIISDSNYSVGFPDSGKFYFAPSINYDSFSENNFETQRTITFSFTDNGIAKQGSLTINVVDGYSPLELNNSVFYGITSLDTFKIQQRLKYLGFTDSNGNSLAVDGIVGPLTDSAIKLFQATVYNGDGIPNVQTGKINPNSETLKWLNATNAPKWEKLVDNSTKFDIENNVNNQQVFGTSWVIDLIENVSNNLSSNSVITRISGYGDSIDNIHKDGKDLDIRYGDNPDDWQQFNQGNGTLNDTNISDYNQRKDFYLNQLTPLEKEVVTEILAFYEGAGSQWDGVLVGGDGTSFSPDYAGHQRIRHALNQIDGRINAQSGLQHDHYHISLKIPSLESVDDNKPTVSVSDASVIVPAGVDKTAEIVFTVELSQTSDRPISLKFNTLDGTAVSKDTVKQNDQLVDTNNKEKQDYDSQNVTVNYYNANGQVTRANQIVTNGELEFNAGEKSATLSFTVKGENPIDDKTLEIFARDTAYRYYRKNVDEGKDVDWEVVKKNETETAIINYQLDEYGDLGYYIHTIIDDEPVDDQISGIGGGNETGFYAVGLTSDETFSLNLSLGNNEQDAVLGDATATGTIYDAGKAPVFAIRGSREFPDWIDDGNADGVGQNQFDNNREASNNWLRQASQLGFAPHITGHSLGGALTQKVAVAYAGDLGQIVTFNAPGVNQIEADKITVSLTGETKKNNNGNEYGIEKILHYVTSADIVSYAGDEHLQGDYILSSYKGGVGSVFLFEKHTNPVIIDYLERSDANRPSINSPTNFNSDNPITTENNLNDYWFTYLPDSDYFKFLSTIAAGGLTLSFANPWAGLTGPVLAGLLTFRGTTELGRGGLGEIIGGVETIIDAGGTLLDWLTSAYSASKNFVNSAWDLILDESAEIAQEYLPQGITIQNLSTQESLLSVNNEITIANSEIPIVDNFWEAMPSWSEATWNALADTPDRAWEIMKTWEAPQWTATTLWSDDVWNYIGGWDEVNWDAIANWGDQIWQSSQNWAVSEWELDFGQRKTD